VAEPDPQAVAADLERARRALRERAAPLPAEAAPEAPAPPAPPAGDPFEAARARLRGEAPAPPARRGLLGALARRLRR
jgi:hypothetical protein